MKRIASVLVMVFAAVAAFAQNTTVKGIVLDKNTSEPEPYAVVQFLAGDGSDKVVAFVMTTEEGAFSQNLPSKGDYVLLLSNVGRKEVRTPFQLEGQKEYDFGQILLEDDVQALKAASVVAQAPLVKMDVDKMTYKVSDDVDSKTSTVLDMLRKVPMVTVDGQDNISVNGSSNFQVFVDGKPNKMLSSNPSQIFKVMPASFVKTIDVITNPGVKYDAEGVGGVLNITTNKEATGGASVADGQYGTIRLNGGTRGFGGGVFYNMQKGKWTFGVNANAMYNNMDGTITDETRVRQDAAGDETTKMHTESRLKTPMVMANISAGYEIDSLNQISATFGIMDFGMKSTGLTSTSILYADGTTAGYDGTSVMNNDRNSITASADWSHSWANVPQRLLTVSYQLSMAPSVNNTENSYGHVVIPGYDLTDRKTEGGSNAVDNTLQVDFTTPLASHSTLNAGAKYIDRHNSSNQTNYIWEGSSFVETPVGSLDYDFYNRIGAGYLEYEGNFGVVGIKGGVRYEHTWQNVTYAAGQGKDFTLDYGNLVPSASIQFNISQIQNIGLSYNQRISRPGITYLNPYVDVSNPFAKSYGNTDLETENTHNFNLVYNFMSPNFMANVTLRHSRTGNGISQYSFFDDDHILNTTYGNILKSRSTGVNGFLMISPGKKTRIIVNGGASYLDLSSEMLAQANKGWSYNAMVGLQQTLPLDLRLSANIISAGSSVTLQGSSTGINLAMVGLTKTFLDDKLSISVNGVGSLKGIRYINLETHSEGPGFISDSVNKVPMGQITCSLSYTFGKQSGYSTMRKARSQEDDVINTQNLSQSMGSIMNNY